MWRCAPREIDAIKIYWAGLLAMRRAIDGLKLAPQHLLIEAKRLKEVTIPQQAIIKEDAKSASIAAASILPKVSRDALMRTLDECHSGYGFADHKGYPVGAYYVARRKVKGALMGIAKYEIFGTDGTWRVLHDGKC